MEKATPLVQRLRKIREARAQLGNIGETTTYNLVAEGKLELVKIGTRSFITQDSIDALIASLPRATLRRKLR